MSEETQIHPFIEYLHSLRQAENRAALAELRRGLRTAAGTAPETFRYVARWVPVDAYPSEERRYYLIASLFALYPEPGGRGNMGDHFAAVAAGDKSAEATEQRFAALLAVHEDDLPYHLRQAVSLCKSEEVPINWNQLFRDLGWWSHADRWVQRRWANSFWGQRSPVADTAADVMTT